MGSIARSRCRPRPRISRSRTALAAGKNLGRIADGTPQLGVCREFGETRALRWFTDNDLFEAIPTMAEDDFPALLDRARTGDSAAVEELLVLIRPHLERVASEYSSTDAGESTTDFVQESWLDAWHKLDQFRGNGADTLPAFKAWTRQIVRTKILKAHRRRSAQKRPDARRKLTLGAPSSERPTHDPVASESTPSGHARQKEEARRIQDALARIEDATIREVVRMRFFEQRSLREIATALEITYDQTRDRFHRGLAWLGRDLRSLAAEDLR